MKYYLMGILAWFILGMIGSIIAMKNLKEIRIDDIFEYIFAALFFGPLWLFSILMAKYSKVIIWKKK